ncbi:MAG: ORF6N domain-containing protein [Mariprofundaceae bacterium]|nr:ORF6N domain-containing protein [Mariprofundaceae bacterium]
MSQLIPVELVEKRILLIRGQKIMLDADLAEMYGVETRALNQAVKRNLDRFPPDFMFQLSREEKWEVITNCDHLSKLKFSKTLPYAFSKHGALMVASVLNTQRAVEVSVFVVRAFVQLREMIASHKDLARKFAAMGEKYDKHFKVVFDAIRQLMAEPPSKKRPIGFIQKDTGK